jgi:hypothetical protein
MQDEYDFSNAEQGKFYVSVNKIDSLKSDEVQPKTKRIPSAAIAGNGNTLGDIVRPMVDTEDWECLK